MTCGTCAVHVKKALENIPGVQSAHVPYTKGGAQFVLNAGASPTPLIAAVAGLGYCSTLLTPRARLRALGCSTRCENRSVVATKLATTAACISLSSTAPLKAVEQGSRVAVHGEARVQDANSLSVRLNEGGERM